MNIQITPVSVFPNTATQIEFLPAEVTFGVKARAQYILKDESGANLTSNWVEMTTEQYLTRGLDDDTAVNIFLANLGVTKA